MCARIIGRQGDLSRLYGGLGETVHQPLNETMDVPGSWQFWGVVLHGMKKEPSLEVH